MSERYLSDKVSGGTDPAAPERHVGDQGPGTAPGSAPTYSELQQRLELTESALQALPYLEDDALSGDREVLLAHITEAEAREAQIKQVLLAIRNVNQLIVSEDNPQRLIRRTCQELTAIPAYHNAWIAFLDETDAVTMTASSGLDGGFSAIQESLRRGELPSCLRQALAQDELVVINDPPAECSGCPLDRDSACRAGLARRLIANRTRGALIASVPATSARDTEEQELFNELAGDLAFAMRKIEDAETLAHREAELRATLYGIGDAVIATDVSGRVTRMNRVAEQLTGWTEAEANGRPLAEVFDIVNEETRRQVENPVARVLREGTVVGLANHTLLVARNGAEVPIADSGAPIIDAQGDIAGVVLVFRDQSEERLIRRFFEVRLALIEYAVDHTLQELLTRALDEVGAFVESPIGFYHFVAPDQQTLTLQQWSTRTLQEFCQAEARGMHYGIAQAGVWVDCVHERKPVIHNDYASLPHKKGMPPGHARVIRELVVPVMRESRVVAILGVGNKPTDYTEKDADIVSYLADVTWTIVHQKRSGEALQESERRFRTLYEAMIEGVCLHELVCDAGGEAVDYRIIDANPSYERILGIERADVIGKLASQVYGADEPPYLETYAAVVRSGKPVQFETYFAPMDKHFLITAFSPGTNHFATVFSEISELKRAGEALRASEERFRDVVSSIPGAVYQFVRRGDGSLEIPFMSDGARQLFERPLHELQDSSLLFDDVHPDDVPGMWTSIEESMRTMSPWKRDFRLVPRPDHVKWLRGVSNPSALADGGICWTGVLLDITERKRAEEEKERLEEQFRQSQKLESIGHLAGGVAHDLNNLLLPILGYSELLLEETGDHEDNREPLQEIMKAAERARDLVSQLLAFSRKQTMKLKSIDLNFLLHAFEKLLRRTIREDINIRMILAPSLPPILADTGQLEQVVMNLAVNARDAMPDGGELRIETRQVELDESYADRHDGVLPGSYVQLVVSDTGSGIDAKVRERLFEPFFTTKERGRGTGLGLATVYGIVKQHGGAVWSCSKPGSGATFKVCLPVATGAVDSTELFGSLRSELKGSETVLLVEDDEQVRHLTRTILQRHGYTVLTAGRGKDALAILESHDGPVHLLLTDVVMPEMNGKELYQRVTACHPTARVLYMSGYSDNVIAHHGVIDQGIHLLQKPFSNQTLATKVREVLES
jgi:PAS domain S-box-containing protein